MEIERIIASRRSIRQYEARRVEKEKIKGILYAGLQAPSGKNGQPWNFIIVQEDKQLLQKLSGCTIYMDFVGTADALVLVFLKKSASYHYVKDVQAIGACIENMLLQATAYGLGSCWIGEILNKEQQVKELLDLDADLELMAIITLGYPRNNTPSPRKKSLSDCVIKTL